MHAGGIIAWVALGPKLNFDNDWQLDVNTATAVELCLMTSAYLPFGIQTENAQIKTATKRTAAFLQNTKRRHRHYMHLCSDRITSLTLELHERLCIAADQPKVCDFTHVTCRGS